ncbi:hypothetical protein EXIGLDRAFT_841092 [Exidia glandulosa HHB12029]|uniref:FAD/NAD(P)-binding domain-containing protein n=1 Tax=Exidia glandulosa HHB12029 TaxID=1314781 RepID=A0A165E323_EXIGL|nr:hypothetical protein EXIGLDRAFT_841092 [Exidia glandulosa HHB12029]
MANFAAPSCAMLLLNTYALLLLVGLAICYLLPSALRTYLMRKYTALVDVKHVGTPRQDGKKLPGTAVVCGGSIAGLYAARICSDHFERVVIIEPEPSTFSKDSRAQPNDVLRDVDVGDERKYKTVRHTRTRVMQYTAGHAYQVLSLLFFRKLFSRFDTRAKQWGMHIAAADTNMRVAGVAIRPSYEDYYGSFPETLVASRRTLEPFIRSLVAEASPSIEFVAGTVSDFTLDYGGAVRSVRVRLNAGGTQDIDCALVADCTGVAQVGLKLLPRSIIRFPKNLREDYNPDVYATALEFPLTPAVKERIRALPIDDGAGRPYDTERTRWFITHMPDPAVGVRVMSMSYGTGDSLLVICGAWGLHPLPVNLPMLVDFTRGIVGTELPEWYFKVLEVLKDVETDGVASEFRCTSCSCIHYERASAILPRNFVALGDASMRVNPRFGEGVTKSAVGAITLDATLRSLPPSNASFGPRFFSSLHARTGSIWLSSKTADYARETTVPVEGETRDVGRFMRWYRTRLVRAAAKNPAVASALWHIGQFLAPAPLVFSPSILLAVLRNTLCSSG